MLWEFNFKFLDLIFFIQWNRIVFFFFHKSKQDLFCGFQFWILKCKIISNPLLVMIDESQYWHFQTFTHHHSRLKSGPHLKISWHFFKEKLDINLITNLLCNKLKLLWIFVVLKNIGWKSTVFKNAVGKNIVWKIHFWKINFWKIQVGKMHFGKV